MKEVKNHDTSFEYNANKQKAWYSEEYRGTGNGQYYIAVDENTAIFIENDGKRVNIKMNCEECIYGHYYETCNVNWKNKKEYDEMIKTHTCPYYENEHKAYKKIMIGPQRNNEKGYVLITNINTYPFLNPRIDTGCDVRVIHDFNLVRIETNYINH